MFDTFADGKDIGVRCHHLIRHGNAAPDIKVGVIGKAHFGSDAHSHADQIGTVNGAIFQGYSLYPVSAQNGLGRTLAVNGDPPRLQRFLQQVTGGGVQLAFHQVAHEVNDRHVHAALLHACRGLQPQQTATDHHSLATGFGGGDHLFGVIQIAVGADAGQVLARHRDDKGG